jgi:hypothetical protein
VLKADRRDADLCVEVTKLKRVIVAWPKLGKSWATLAGDDGRDRGDVILSWLSRIVIGIAVFGVVLFDGLSIGVAHVSAADDANSAARSASHAWNDSHDLNDALHAAESSAAEHHETVVPKSFHVLGDGTVDLKVQRSASTLVVRHIEPLRSWTTITAAGSGKYVGS